MNLAYSAATESDVVAIYAQAKNLIDTYEDLESIDYDRVLAWVKKKIMTRIAEYTCVYLDGKICAYYRLCDDGELDDLYVLPGYRGQGIGTQIMNRCIKDSDKTIWLYTFSRNVRAISFYERFGFAVCRTIGDTRLIMARSG